MSGSDKGLELIQEEDTQPSENTGEAHNEVAPIKVEPQHVRVPIRRSARIPQIPDRYRYYEEYELGNFNEPPNYKAALTNPESDKWLEAMNTEMQSMRDNQVWYLVDLPSNGRTIGCKWLFKKKTDMDGNVHTFKARLMAKPGTPFRNARAMQCLSKEPCLDAMNELHEEKVQKDKKKPQGAKGKGKGKNKLAYAPKAKMPPPPKRDNLAKDSIFHHCKEVLRESRKLKHGAISLSQRENGIVAAVEAIKSFDLILPSGLIIVLDNCH
ncbi:hypothetical protein Tco_0189012 [Tanacetum coccineum]